MAGNAIPRTMKQVIVKSLGTDFMKVTEVKVVNVPKNLKPDEILVETIYVGINASDVNFCAGKYDPTKKPPFPAGLEGMGKVVRVGTGVSSDKIKIDDIVVYVHPGSFSEYMVVPSEKAIVVKKADPAYMSIVLSGLTASISLEEEGQIQNGDTVLVTAAAGGTGQFAVQLAKHRGCTVIGTCSSEEKKTFLKGLGCRHVINYKEENLDEVLTRDFKDAIDVVYESVGQDFFNAALKNLSIKGRIVVIGMISKYHEGQDVSDGSSYVNIPLMCLRKSASVRGFFLLHYRDKFEEHAKKLIGMYESKNKDEKLKIKVDTFTEEGIDNVPKAVNHLFSGKTEGKLVVKIKPVV